MPGQPDGEVEIPSLAPAGTGLAAARADGLMEDYLHHREKHFKILIRQIAGSFLNYEAGSFDLLVKKPIQGNKLTNVRASGSDENIILSPPRTFTLEQAIDFIQDDELVEVTPHYIRLRKRILNENERKRKGG